MPKTVADELKDEMLGEPEEEIEVVEETDTETETVEEEPDKNLFGGDETDTETVPEAEEESEDLALLKEQGLDGTYSNVKSALAAVKEKEKFSEQMRQENLELRRMQNDLNKRMMSAKPFKGTPSRLP